MMIKICILVLAAAFVVNAGPAISLLDSNVDVNYGVAAVSALNQAYTISPSPEEEAKRLQSFSQLFGNAYQLSSAWNVITGCSNSYLPNNPKYVTLKVVEDGATEDQAKIIRIFSDAGGES